MKATILFILTLSTLLAHEAHGKGLRRAPHYTQEGNGASINCLICNVKQDSDDSYACSDDEGSDQSNSPLFRLDHVSSSFWTSFVAKVQAGASRICIPNGTYNRQTHQVEVPDGTVPIVAEDNNIFNAKALLATGVPATTTTTTTTTSTTSDCKDSAELVPFNGRLLPCEWIASKALRIEAACVTGATAMIKCPVTCGTCPSTATPEPVRTRITPTKQPKRIQNKHIFATNQGDDEQSTESDSPPSPTAGPSSTTSTPAPSPRSQSGATCQDTEELITYQGRRLPCAWVASKAYRIERICGLGGEVLVKCPHTCNSCPSATTEAPKRQVSPTAPPTQEEDTSAAVPITNKVFGSQSSSTFTVPPTPSPTPEFSISNKMFPPSDTFTAPPTATQMPTTKSNHGETDGETDGGDEGTVTSKVFPSSSTFTVPPTPAPSTEGNDGDDDSTPAPIGNKLFRSAPAFTVPPTDAPSSVAITSGAVAPTAAPSKAAVATEVTETSEQSSEPSSSSSCQDTTDLVFYSGRFVTCSWVALEQSRIDVACVVDGSAWTTCPATCHNCGSAPLLSRIAPAPEGSSPSPPTHAPTTTKTTDEEEEGGREDDEDDDEDNESSVSSTTSVQANATSSSSSSSSCEDGDQKFNYQDKERNCAWIALAKSRVRYACQPGQAPYDVCQKTCGRCESTSSSSSSSTSSNNDEDDEDEDDSSDESSRRRRRRRLLRRA